MRSASQVSATVLLPEYRGKQADTSKDSTQKGTVTKTQSVLPPEADASTDETAASVWSGNIPPVYSPRFADGSANTAQAPSKTPWTVPPAETNGKRRSSADRTDYEQSIDAMAALHVTGQALSNVDHG